MADVATLGLAVDSRPVVAANQNLEGLGRTAAKTERATEGFERSAKRAGTATARMAADVNRADKAMAAMSRTMGAAGAVIGAAIASAFSVQSLFAFKDALAEVSTLVDTATFDMKALEKAALAQSAAFGGTAASQAKAFYSIISAGASSSAQATDILTASNKLAVGGVTSVAIASDGLTSVLNAYGSKVENATAVSDALFVAMRAGKTTIGELSSGLGQVAPLAATLNVSFDELVASVSALTKGGIATSQAITGVRAVLAAVAKPSSEAAKLARQLGIEFNSAGLETKGFKGFLDDLVARTGGSTDALAQLFGGVEALVPIMALSGQAGKDFTAILEQMAAKAGSTQVAFDKMASSPGFQAGRVWAALQAEVLGTSGVLSGPLTAALKTIADNMGAIVAVATIFTAGHLAAAILPVIANMLTLATSMGTAAAAARALSIAMAFIGGPIGLAVAGIAGAYLLLRDNVSAAEQAAIDANTAFNTNERSLNAAKGSSEGYTGALRNQIAMQVEAAKAALTEADAQLAVAKARALGFRETFGFGFDPLDYSAEQARIQALELDGAYQKLEQQLAQVDANMKSVTTSTTSSGLALGDAGDEAKKLAEKYVDIVRGSQQFIAAQKLEQQVMGMSAEAANALRYQQDLMNKARDAGIKLTPKQTSELTKLAGEMASVEAQTDKMKRATDAAKEAAKEFADTLGSVLADLFTKPIEDFDDFMERIMSGFAQLGQVNLQKAFDGLFSGGGPTAANDNFAANTTFGEFLGAAVEKGARVGTTEGGIRGLLSGFQLLGGGSQAGAGAAGGGMTGGALSAGLGGFGMGYQSQSPLMGAVGGAMSGWAAGAAMGSVGGPLGAVIGALAGALGGLFGNSSAKKKERQAASNELDKNTAAMEALFAVGQGRGIGEFTDAINQFYDETAKFVELAYKAGDTDLALRLQANVNSFIVLMEKDFMRGFDGMLEALRSGLGSDSPFVKGKESIEDLRDELKNFVADAQGMGDMQIKHGFGYDAAMVAERVAEAEQAAQAMALAVLGGAQTLSTMEGEVLRLDGVAAGLQVTLEELGMTAGDAANAIADNLVKALDDLVTSFTNDINRSINDLSGFDFLNDLIDAQARYQLRLRDSAALGLDGSLALREFNLSLAEIVESSGLSQAQIDMLAEAFPGMRGMIASVAATATEAQDAVLSVTDAQNQLREAYDAQTSAILGSIAGLERFIDTSQRFRASIRLSAVSPLSQADQTAEALKQFRDTAMLAAGGDEAARDRLTDVGQAALDEARAYYASSEDYFRIWQEVDRTLLDMESSAGDQLSEAQKQLAALDRQVEALIDIDQSVMSVTDAINALAAAQAATGGAGPAANDNQFNFDDLAKQLNAVIKANQGGYSPEVTKLYSDVVGRRPDYEGSLGWQAGFDAGMPKDEIYKLFIRDVIAAGASSQLKPGIAAQYGVPGFASGGMHMGGLRLVGERGPELEATGPARIYSAPQTRAMLSNDNSAVVSELREMRAENAKLTRAVERLGSMIGLSDEETRKVLREGNETMAETSSALKKVASR